MENMTFQRKKLYLRGMISNNIRMTKNNNKLALPPFGGTEGGFLTVEVTADGSATLFVPALDEHYHSVKGALTEAEHIYRDCAFLHRAAMNDGLSVRRPLRLLEVGFGTGLNTCVTAMAASDTRPVHYIALEKYPVEADLLERLDYGRLVDKHLMEEIHRAPWDEPVPVTPHFTLEKRRADYLTDRLPTAIDVVYFDAFAPEKQPEMWSAAAFARLVEVMDRDAVLTTYCAKGEVRRLLASLGLKMERIPGPAGGKREILRGKLKIKS